ncbi:hypothetical protein [Pseudokineococcus lusitanus]|uniref:Uncharacterized protein n=1 Tax=Pseudokineococcus lusitanus TaxID=763993 RepID=A0A3N1GWB1_9ACTN|nr:hypothetical protein [Pseudokineococcus lusitanus]ROP34529.1 hypothetical protein EDC03_2343 [Pseudokineococcus lusitanus]
MSTDLTARPGPVPAGAGPGRVLGLSTPHLRTTADADATAARLAAVPGVPAGTLVATTWVVGPPRHLALVVLAPSGTSLPDALVADLLAAAGATGPDDAVAARAAGGDADRVVVLPGAEHLVGVLDVGELLRRSALDVVVGLGGLVVPDDAVVDTRGHVRPRLAGGQLVLDVQPARDGRWVPFESPVHRACCSAH